MKHQYDLYTTHQTRELDRLAIELDGISGFTLMQRAGQSVFKHIQQRWPEARQLAIFCGAGNNAGDGYIVARLAHEAGMTVHVYTLSDPVQLPDDACRAWQETTVEERENLIAFLLVWQPSLGIGLKSRLGTSRRCPGKTGSER